ncbi:MAG: D-glycero-alpha-D-manno-heptose-1,7-bisphosphate 7-phosphatase [Cyclobacteriaceae bacterium]
MTILNKCVFLDRDGVLNEDRVNYAYHLDHFKILPGVSQALAELKAAGFRLVVITNQSGISQGIYSVEEMKACHAYLQEQCNHPIDYFYYCPYHPTVSASLARKPGTLMFEKAIARFNVDVTRSWMVGDRARDLIPARELGVKTIQIGHDVEPDHAGDHKVGNLSEAAQIILSTAS